MTYNDVPVRNKRHSTNCYPSAYYNTLISRLTPSQNVLKHTQINKFNVDLNLFLEIELFDFFRLSGFEANGTLEYNVPSSHNVINRLI